MDLAFLGSVGPGQAHGSETQSRRATFQRRMILMIVLVAMETIAPPGLDVGGQIIDVKGFLGHQFVAIDRRLIKAIERFHAADFMRHHGAVEVGKHRISLVDPWVVDRVDVGKKDQTMAFRGPSLGELPGFRNRRENRAPSGDEFLGTGAAAQCFERPCGKRGGIDATAFQIIAFDLEQTQPFGGIAQLSGDQGVERFFVIKAQQYVAYVKQDGHGARVLADMTQGKEKIV